MSIELRPCGLQGWAFCDGNCENCRTTADSTTMADGYWYHGSGKLMGEFCHIKPNDKERYGEYVKVVRCKDCKLFDPEHEGGIGSCGIDMNVTANDYCSKAKRKDEVEE